MGYEGDREVMLEEGFEWEEVREGDIGKEEGGGEEEGDKGAVRDLSSGGCTKFHQGQVSQLAHIPSVPSCSRVDTASSCPSVLHPLAITGRSLELSSALHVADCFR